MGEFGATFDNEVYYMGDAETNSAEEFQRFIVRARGWVDKHGIVLGEGMVDFKVFSEGPSAFRLRAPKLSGPTGICDVVIDWD
jgi:hypothetical protein